MKKYFCIVSELREIVKRQIKQHRHTMLGVSKALGYSHVNGLKYQLDQEPPNWTIIEKIGKIIEHDFTMEFPNMPHTITVVTENQEPYIKNVSLSDAMGQINYLRKKVTDLQEELITAKDEIIRLQRKLPNY